MKIKYKSVATIKNVFPSRNLIYFTAQKTPKITHKTDKQHRSTGFQTEARYTEYINQNSNQKYNRTITACRAQCLKLNKMINTVE